MPREARISINGHELDTAQAVVVRVAVSALLLEIKSNEQHRDALGELMTRSYEERLSEVEKLLLENVPTTTTHPDQQDGEVFWVNISAGMIQQWLEFRRLPWKTKRLGTRAYGLNGKQVPGLRPVFVKREEMESRGTDPDWREKYQSMKQQPYEI